MFTQTIYPIAPPFWLLQIIIYLGPFSFQIGVWLALEITLVWIFYNIVD